NREAKRTIQTVTLVGIRGEVRIVRFKVVIEDTTAQAYTVNGEVWVGNGELRVSLVVVFRPVDTDRVARTQPVILLNTDLEAHATFSTVTNTEVEATGITFFNFINNINLSRTTWYTLSIGIDRFEVAQTVQTLFTLIYQIASQPCPFHLAHFTAQNGVFRGIVTFEADLTHVEAVARINVNVQLNGFIRVVNFRLRLHTRIRITITAEQLLNAVFHFGDFRSAVQIARLNFGQRFNFS